MPRIENPLPCARNGRIIVDESCVAESIRWFGGEGQNSGPYEIALEGFLARIDDLKITCDRIIMVGSSFGSEAAMLCGAYSKDVDDVVAISPSDVVWGAFDSDARATSHWTLESRVLPFMPLDFEGFQRSEPLLFRPVCERSRRTMNAELSNPKIPVERK